MYYRRGCHWHEHRVHVAPERGEGHGTGSWLASGRTDQLCQRRTVKLQLCGPPGRSGPRAAPRRLAQGHRQTPRRRRQSSPPQSGAGRSAQRRRRDPRNWRRSLRLRRDLHPWQLDRRSRREFRGGEIIAARTAALCRRRVRRRADRHDRQRTGRLPWQPGRGGRPADRGQRRRRPAQRHRPRWPLAVHARLPDHRQRPHRRTRRPDDRLPRPLGGVAAERDRGRPLRVPPVARHS